jgi:hypothetical protein
VHVKKHTSFTNSYIFQLYKEAFIGCISHHVYYNSCTRNRERVMYQIYCTCANETNLDIKIEIYIVLLNYYTNHCTYIKFIFFLHIKTLETLRHVSVLRPSSGSYIFLAKVTLEIVTC